MTEAAHKAVHDSEVAALFQFYNKASQGFSNRAVLDAAGTVLVSAMKQRHATRASAETEFNEMFGRMKQHLLDLYVGPAAKPATQHIIMPHVDFRDKF
jgi:hypothetical protein